MVRGLVLQFFEATMNLPPVLVLCIFGNHYIIGSYFTVNVFAVFDVNFNNFLLRL